MLGGAHHQSAAQVRRLLARGALSPEAVRARLVTIPSPERDSWWDAICGIEGIPTDGAELPRGCVPYLPCSVAILLDMVERANIQARDVFVDLGSGLGRALALTHFLTGASAVGVEVQSHLVASSRALMHQLNARQVSILWGDAVDLVGRLTTGTVFFLYCPFSGDRLERAIDALEPIARAHPIRVCCVDLSLPPRRWLEPLPQRAQDLIVYRSTFSC